MSQGFNPHEPKQGLPDHNDSTGEAGKGAWSYQLEPFSQGI